MGVAQNPLLKAKPKIRFKELPLPQILIQSPALSLDLDPRITCNPKFYPKSCCRSRSGNKDHHSHPARDQLSLHVTSLEKMCIPIMMLILSPLSELDVSLDADGDAQPHPSRLVISCNEMSINAAWLSLSAEILCMWTVPDIAVEK